MGGWIPLHGQPCGERNPKGENGLGLIGEEGKAGDNQEGITKMKQRNRSQGCWNFDWRVRNLIFLSLHKNPSEKVLKAPFHLQHSPRLLPHTCHFHFLLLPTLSLCSSHWDLPAVPQACTWFLPQSSPEPSPSPPSSLCSTSFSQLKLFLSYLKNCPTNLSTAFFPALFLLIAHITLWLTLYINSFSVWPLPFMRMKAKRGQAQNRNSMVICWMKEWTEEEKKKWKPLLALDSVVKSVQSDRV